MPEDPKTRNCESCGVVVAASEKVCPACGSDSEADEVTIKELERIEKIRAARAEKNKPAPKTEPTPAKKRGLLDNLRKATK